MLRATSTKPAVVPVPICLHELESVCIVPYHQLCIAKWYVTEDNTPLLSCLCCWGPPLLNAQCVELCSCGEIYAQQSRFAYSPSCVCETHDAYNTAVHCTPAGMFGGTYALT